MQNILPRKVSLNSGRQILSRRLYKFGRVLAIILTDNFKKEDWRSYRFLAQLSNTSRPVISMVNLKQAISVFNSAAVLTERKNIINP